MGYIWSRDIAQEPKGEHRGKRIKIAGETELDKGVPIQARAIPPPFGLRREVQRHAAFLGVFSRQAVFQGKRMAPNSFAANGTPHGCEAIRTSAPVRKRCRRRALPPQSISPSACNQSDFDASALAEHPPFSILLNRVAADVRRLIHFLAMEVRASLRRLLRFTGGNRATRTSWFRTPERALTGRENFINKANSQSGPARQRRGSICDVWKSVNELVVKSSDVRPD